MMTMMILVIMKKTIPILSQIKIFNLLCQLRIMLEILIILMTLSITGYGKFEIKEHHLDHLLEPQDSLLDPPNTNPVDFFNLLFEDQMYELIACETNRYAESKMQSKFLILHKFISDHLNSTVISSMCKLIN